MVTFLNVERAKNGFILRALSHEEGTTTVLYTSVPAVVTAIDELLGKET